MSEAQGTGFHSPAVQPGTQSVGDFQRLLTDNIGQEVVAEFVVGLDEIVEKAGVITAVTEEYLLLYDDVNLIYVACDLKGLQFLTFYQSGTRPIAETGRSGEGATSQSVGSNAARSPAVRGVTAAHTAALNYAKRKAQKLE